MWKLGHYVKDTLLKNLKYVKSTFKYSMGGLQVKIIFLILDYRVHLLHQQNFKGKKKCQNIICTSTCGFHDEEVCTSRKISLKKKKS